MQRKTIGRKGDGYVRSIGSRSIDRAASEAGPKWEGKQGTKFIKECSLTLPKVLKDIFINLVQKKYSRFHSCRFDMLLELKLIEITNAHYLFM
jgi:hypothetical protein